MDNPMVIEQIYNAPRAKVWQALSDQDNLRKWYFPQLIRFEPKTNFQFLFDEDGSVYQKEWRVTNVISGYLLAHSWTYKNFPGYSEVTFELKENGNETMLKLTHTGLSSFPREAHFARRRFEDGWKNILGHNLKNFLGHNL